MASRTVSRQLLQLFCDIYIKGSLCVPHSSHGLLLLVYECLVRKRVHQNVWSFARRQNYDMERKLVAHSPLPSTLFLKTHAFDSDGDLLEKVFLGSNSVPVRHQHHPYHLLAVVQAT